MPPTSIFSPEHYAATRLPLHQASNLPGWCYSSADWYRREVETIFLKDWLCVGRAEQIPAAGDYFTMDLVGRPLVVVRDEGGEVRVHSALCRHRGAVVAEGAGRCRAFVCPYHGWTYGLGGKLIGTPGTPPPMAGVEGFRAADYGLSPVRSAIWGGFIFVTFDATAPALHEWLGDLPQFLAGYDLENMQWTHRDTLDVDVNWKVWAENAFESYHAWTVHRKHMSVPQEWAFESPRRGPWTAMFSRHAITSFSGLPRIATLEDEKAQGLFHLWLQPSLQIILASSYMKFRQYLPGGPEKVRIQENWTFPKSTVARADFDQIVGPAYYEKYAQIVDEDLEINPKVQRAMRSGAFQPGRYSLDEYVVHRIANFVLDRVVGPDDGPGRRAREAYNPNPTIWSAPVAA